MLCLKGGQHDANSRITCLAIPYLFNWEKIVWHGLAPIVSMSERFVYSEESKKRYCCCAISIYLFEIQFRMEEENMRENVNRTKD